MSLRSETESLRQRLRRMSCEPDTDFYQRYFFSYLPQQDLSLFRRLRIFIGRLLRHLGLRREQPLEPWVAELNQNTYGKGAKPYLIWAIDIDRDTLRAACKGFEAQQGNLPGWVPVLITNVPDFATFSRLGWLVEYVPELSAPASNYSLRKSRYLAWRYRDAPVLPVSAGLTEESLIGDLLID